MNYVFYSSSLMYLGKTKILEKVKLISDKNFISKKVYEEVIVKGLERKDPEVSYVNTLIENKLFIIKEAKNILNNIGFLSEADKEVISLAKETKSIAIIDETYAKRIAIFQGIETHGSVYIIIKFLENKLLTKKEAKDHINRMIELGFYLSIKKYKDILATIEKL